MLYPLTFHPLFKERVWGGRNIGRLYGKALPPSVPIGESWEISDRPGDVSVIANGPLSGKDLHWLLETHGKELLGTASMSQGRFPLLVKILDAQEKLSLQVHPPAALAATLKGEPKTEMWYIADATPDADLFVGLKPGVTRAVFESKVADGTVESCFHRVTVKPGDAMFLPSGRVHAIGAGNVIFEIQQNSDTTYRVFDWNRTGLDGKPRELHVEQSLKSIDFDDIEPSLVSAGFSPTPSGGARTLVNDSLFRVEVQLIGSGQQVSFESQAVQILGVVHGSIRVLGGGVEVSVPAGGFCVLPADPGRFEVRAAQDCDVELLRTIAGPFAS